LWHHVDLRVKDWLGKDTGLLHYVNEIPRNALQKFEIHTRVEKNTITEDTKGSRRLLGFGRPVPFNYGCFPQTFRDPDEIDDIYGAPGDDDPLDVVDLSPKPVGVGEIASCTPLGAVCLIDEGRADWKILVVNTDAPGPLANARSIDEVERLAPGRIQEALQWMDDFKQYGNDSCTRMHFEIHDESVARAIINKDHAAWKRLVDNANSKGLSKGHWIRPSGSQAETPPSLGTFPIRWATPFSFSTRGNLQPSFLVGSSVATSLPYCVAERSLKVRRRTSAASGSSSSSPRSSDTDIG
jgi:inorganic pyrophosphatase